MTHTEPWRSSPKVTPPVSGTEQGFRSEACQARTQASVHFPDCLLPPCPFSSKADEHFPVSCRRSVVFSDSQAYLQVETFLFFKKKKKCRAPHENQILGNQGFLTHPLDSKKKNILPAQDGWVPVMCSPGLELRRGPGGVLSVVSNAVSSRPASIWHMAGASQICLFVGANI